MYNFNHHLKKRKDSNVKKINTFEAIGSDLGLLFQISDDLIDYKGDPINIYLSEDGNTFTTITLGEQNQFHFTVKANTWFAMKSIGKYSLVGCSVAPAFDYEDFELAPLDWKPETFDSDI